MPNSLMTILKSLADAFLTVGVYVAVIFALTGWLRVRWGRRFEDSLLRRRRVGPLAAGLMALPPGCIGVLAVSRLYVRGTTSYGTVIAALVSTMGDSAWLLLAEKPMLTIGLKLAFFGLGTAVGYGIDAAGVAPRARQGLAAVGSRSAQITAAEARGGDGGGRPVDQVADSRQSIPADDCDPPTECAAPTKSAPLPVRTVVFWASVAVGLAVSLPSTLHIVDEEAFGVIGVLIGAAGFVTSLVIFLGSRCRVVCGEESHDVERSVREVLRNGASETAFVTFWVAAIFAAWELFVETGLIVPETLHLAGAAGVLLGALAGLIPACGVEILVSALFITGVVPFPALVAYLLSQDGNGFIPIAARHPRAALHASILTTLVAVIAGFIVLAVT